MLYRFIIVLIALYAVTATIISTPSTIQTQMSSKGVNVSEIQSLKSDIQSLKDNIGRWNTGNIVCIFLAFLAAGGLVITSIVLQRKNDVLTKAEDKLTALNEAQYKADSKEKDLKISTAQSEASKADVKAGKANEAAGEANNRAEELKAQNLATEATLEEERSKRLELEKSLTPRTLVLVFNKGVPDLPTLLPYAGLNVILEALPDAETFRATGSVQFAIEAAGWKVSNVLGNFELNQGYFDGVVISASLPATKMNGPAAEYEDAQRCWNAAEALVAYLNSKNWVSRVAISPRSEGLPTNTIKISVGMKPNPYFTPKEFQPTK